MNNLTLLTTLTPILSAPRWYIAYSGGVDSHVLLHRLVQLRAQTPQPLPPLHALHINHQLHPDATQWVEHCEQVCKQLQVPLHIITVDIKRQMRTSIEEAARHARYQAFAHHLNEGEALLLAHHLDDQIETLFLRLLRGSGVRGIASIPMQRAVGQGVLLRPLLTVTRQAIVDYAQREGLVWVDDPSNVDERYPRNYLRHRCLPIIAQCWPRYRQTLQRVLAWSDEAQQLHTELAQLDSDRLGIDTNSQTLSLAALQSLNRVRQKNLLRYYLQQRQLPLPSSAQLQQIIDQLTTASDDAQPLVQWQDIEARRFAGNLYILPKQSTVDRLQRYQWQLATPLRINDVGCLRAEQVVGSGVRCNDELTVAFRQGGERCRPANKQHSQTLKKLLQMYQVPPWERDRVPLLFDGDRLVAVADYWVCAGYQATGEQRGWCIRWQRG